MPDETITVHAEPTEHCGIRRSDSIAQLAAALAAAQGQMAGAAKDSVNPHFQSRYADLASVWDACREALSKNGLAVMQPVSTDGHQRVTVTTILAHKSGEWVERDLILTAQQATPQAVGSAITYGRRYGLGAMVGVAPEDDDAEAAEGRDGRQTGHGMSPQPAVREEASKPSDPSGAGGDRGQGGKQAPPPDCPIHGTPMLPSRFNPGQFYHKVDDKNCTGKKP